MFSIIKNKKVMPLVVPSTADEAKADQLVERLRDLLLQNNSNGAFATLGITPRVFVKNFEQRIHHLLLTRQEHQIETLEGGTGDGQIHVDYAFRNKGTYTEGQLRLQLRFGDDVYPAVTLLTFSGKIAGDPLFQELLPQVKSVLDDFFPVVVMHSSSTSSDNVEKGIVHPVADIIAPCHQRLRRQNRALACGGELGAALAAYKQKGSHRKVKQRNVFTATCTVVEKLPQHHHHQKVLCASIIATKGPSSISAWQLIRAASVVTMVAFYFWYLRPSL